METEYEKDYFQLGPRHRLPRDRNRSFFMTYLISKLEMENELYPPNTRLRNNKTSTNKELVKKRNSKLSNLWVNNKEKIIDFSYYYIGLPRDIDKKEVKTKRFSRAREYFNRLQKKLQFGKLRYSNSDFDRIYSEMKLRQKLKNKKMHENIYQLNSEMSQLKKIQFNAKYLVMGLYVFSMPLLLLKKRLTFNRTILISSGLYGFHVFTQYTIAEYYYMKLKNLN